MTTNILTYLTPTVLRTVPGQPLTRYAFVVSLGVVFQWVPGSSATDDGQAVIVPLVGGYLGAWIRVRAGTGASVALANADVTLTFGGGSWYALPAGTLTAPHAATLGTANAAAGDEIEITRYDVSGNTYTVVNGGPAGGNVYVHPASARSFGVAWFDGTNWLHRRSALML